MNSVVFNINFISLLQPSTIVPVFHVVPWKKLIAHPQGEAQPQIIMSCIQCLAININGICF